MRSPRWSCLISVSTALLIPGFAVAQPVPTCPVSGETAPFLGETAQIQVPFGNSGSAPGFMPAVEFFAPAGLTLTAATMETLPVGLQNLGVMSGAGIVHPRTGETVFGPVGSTMYYAELPVSSLAPSAPSLAVVVTYQVDATATLGSPLVLESSCLFALGTDALNNPGSDPPPRSDLASDPADQTTFSATPTVLRLTQTATPDQTVTGPNFPLSFTINVDVANGASIDGFTITNTLDDSFIVTGVTVSPAPSGSVTSPVILPASQPGGLVQVDTNPITGGATASDLSIQVTGYIPEFDRLGAAVLNPVTGAPVIIPNSVLASGAVYNPPAAAPIVLPDTSANASVTARAFLVRQSTADLNGGGVVPGDTLRTTATVHVSDYFDFGSVVLNSVAADGTTYRAATSAPAATGVTGSDPTTISWSVGALNGNEAGGTRRTYAYDFDADEQYASLAYVQGGDVLDMSADLTGTVTSTPAGALASTLASDVGTDGDVTIQSITFTKTLVAVNGGAPPSPLTVEAGDVITFRIQAVAGSGDLTSVTLTDYLPPPLLDAQEHGAIVTVGASGSGSPIRYGPSHDAPLGTTVTVSSAGLASDNFMRFQFGTFQTSPSRAVTFEIDLDYTVRNTPTEDGLAFTNLMVGGAQGNAGSFAGLAFAAFVVDAPELFITRGALSSDGPNATFSPAVPAAPYSSNSLASTPVISDVDDVDAGDAVDFGIVLVNQGNGPAYDVIVTDTLPTDLTYAGAGLSVTDGAGNPVAFGGDLFGAGLTIGSVPGYHATDGSNVIVIRVPTLVGAGIASSETISGTAELTQYASEAGGANFVSAATTDASSVTGSAITLAVGGLGPNVVVRDTEARTITITVPEGTHPGVVLTDVLDAELAYVATPVLVGSAGLTWSGAPVIAADGGDMTFNFGTVTNTNRDDATAETLVLSYDVVILNTSAANHNDRMNTQATLTVPNAANLSASSAEMLLREPRLTIAQTPSATNVDAGDTVTFSVVLTLTPDTAYPAYEPQYTATLPAGLTNLRNFVDSGASAATGSSLVGNTITVDFAQITTGNTAAFSFQADVVGGIGFGTTIAVPGAVTWTSQSGTPAVGSAFNAAALERTGAGGINDYTRSTTTNLSVNPINPGKTLIVGGPDVQVGDLVRYQVSIQVPEGSGNNIDVVDTMPNGLVFVSDASFASSAILTCSVGSCNAPTRVVSANGRTITWSFGNVVNSNMDNGTAETLSWTIDARVSNDSGASNGTALVNNISWGATSGNAAAVTVREPTLTLSTSLPAGTVDTADTRTVTVRLQEVASGAATAHDVVATYTIPAGMSFVGTDSTGTCPAGAVTYNGSTVSFAFTSISNATDCTFSFDVQVDLTAVFGATLPISGTATWSSFAGPLAASQSAFSSLAVERTGNPADLGGAQNDYVANAPAASFSMAPVAFNTSLLSGATARIGDQVTHRVAVTLPEGTSGGIILQADLPSGLVFVQDANLSVSANVTCGGGACLTPTRTVTLSGQRITWDFGALVNNDSNNANAEVLQIDVVSAVANAAAVNHGATLGFTASIGAVSATTPTVTVQEPTLTMTLSNPATPVDAGDTVTFTVALQETGAGSVAAYDGTISVPLPAGLANAANYQAGNCPLATATLGAGSADFAFATLSDGLSCNFTFEATAQTAIAFATDLSVTATGRWTSFPGDLTATQSTFGSATERTGLPADPGGALNDYVVTSNSTVVAPRVASLTGLFVSTSAAETLNADLGIGETVTFDLQVRVPEGSSPNVELVLTPPAGLRLDSASRVLGSFAGTTSADPSSANLGLSPGQAATFSFGTVSNPGNNSAADDVFTLRVFATAIWASGLRSLAPGSVQAVLRISGSSIDTAAISTPLVFGLPALAITASDTTPSAGNPVDYTVTLLNGGSGPVCNTSFTLDIPAGLTLSAPLTDGLDNDFDVLLDAGDPTEAALQSGAAQGRLVIGGCVLPGETRRLVMRAQVDTGVAPNPLLATATLEAYESLAAAGATFLPLSDEADNDLDASVDEALDNEVSVSVTPSAPQLVFTKTVADLSGGSIEPGDTLRYTLSIQNTGTGAAQNVVVTDPVPPTNTTLVAASEATTAGSVAVAAGNLTATLGDIAAGVTVNVRFDVLIDSPLAANTSISNQGSLAADFGYGGLPSDDPSTGAADDATQRSVAATLDLDGDGVPNGSDTDPNDPFVCADADGDTCDDCSVAGVQAISNDGPDADADGLCDAGEVASGGDPNDPDTDDDGLIDGLEPSPLADTDGDGLVNVLDPDSDNDGLYDGTEAGVTVASAGTDVSAGVFVPDQDPATTTDPLLIDTDSGGVPDGAEDLDRDGAVDVGEGDPNVGADDAAQTDTDGDGLPDATEIALCSDPNDRDTDDDGLEDGLEPNYAADTDGDGLINILDPDSDDDGLYDGTEAGVALAGVDTDVSAGVFIADADPSTTTSPVMSDTDRGGVDDGAEDVNHNGRVDAGELDPNVGADDAAPTDTDGDGLTDAEEALIGSNPNDADTDDDGLLDGAESNAGADSDGDGVINVLDPDSDNDGLFDGTERGVTAPHADTDLAAGVFVADADPSTTTSALLADSDGGGITDGAEDINRNGQVDAGEIDPNLASDDASGPTDTDGDGLPDAQEILLGSDPNDIDSDDDGVADGAEPDLAGDTDGDGFINILDPDSDGDGLFDGTESGVTAPTVDTDTNAGFYVADADPSTTTSMLLADTDAGSLADGLEDINGNGRVDAGETDPNLAADDIDSDGDGVPDANDVAPADPLQCRDVDSDTCDDCSLTGANGSGGDTSGDGLDTDGDGLCDAGDPDDDGDGVADAGDSAPTVATQCRDLDADACDDCSLTGADGSGGDVGGDGLDTDGDGLCDAGDPDDDGDGVADGADADPLDPALCRDLDGDSCSDCAITQGDGSGGDPANDGTDTDGDGLCNAGDPDDDNDGRGDGTDSAPLDFTACGDTDSDSCDDCAVTVDGFGALSDADPANDGADLDGDGICDAGDPDDDNDGVADVTDVAPADPNRCRDVDADSCDDCTLTGANGSGGDVANDGADSDGDGICDAGDGDDDGDGVADALDVAPADPNRCRDVDADSCDDCALTGANGSGGAVANDGLDTDGDGICDAGDGDDDDDGVLDAADSNPTNPNICRDVDGDSCDDCVLTGADRSGGAVNNDGLDSDGDGLCDAGDLDDDGDGVADLVDTDPANPNVCRDVDGDTCDDCAITGANGSGGAVNNDGADSDGDGLCDAGDGDDDNDGVADGLDVAPTDPNRCRDVDVDGCDDCVITGADGSGGAVANDGLDTDGDGICNVGDADDDGDGVADLGDTNPTNPNICADADGDSCDDCAITGANGSGGSVSNDGLDTDGDGQCDAGDVDNDNDGVPDGADTNPTNPNVCADADGDTCDDCAITGANGSGGSVTNDGLDTDGDGLCDAGDNDDDGDGVLDGVDSNPTNPNVCRDADGDSCDDCAITGADGSGGSVTNDGLDTDGDGRCDAGDLDDDSDGVLDPNDSNPTNPSICADVDVDSCDDCAITGADGSGGSVSNDGVDVDGDGQCDAGDLDDDNDGVPDTTDTQRTNPNICADADGDGCDDCAITGADGSGGSVSNDGLDTDGDGQCDAGDPDTDNDGVPDGSDSNPTNPNVCADADADTCDDCALTGANGSGGATNGDGPDVDGDGLCDAGDLDDDNDGVPDTTDTNISNPNVCADADGDSCDDCAITGADGSGGAVANDGPDNDGDGQCDAGDLDDDNDGVPDTTDANPTNPNICRDADADGCDDCVITGADGSGGSTTNDGLDTDGDGRCDAGDGDDDEDGVLDGVDSDPTNPNVCADADGDTCDDCAITGANRSGGSTGNDGLDTDGDGLCDAGDLDDDGDGVTDAADSNPTNPNICRDVDNDTCDDCAITGANGSGGTVSNDGPDTDGDGICDVGDPDSDNDGVPDATDSSPLNPNVCADMDADGCDDCAITGADSSGGSVANDGLDTDGDGICDAGDVDNDNDGVPDATDNNPNNPNVCADADADGCDDCAITGADNSGGSVANDGADNDADGICDAGDLDDDNDGVLDLDDSNPSNPNICRDADRDSCDDCAITGADNSGGAVANDGLDTDADGLCDAGDADDDDDGVPDTADTDPVNPNVCADADADTCDDCAVTGANRSGGSVSNDGLDTDADGLCDAGDPDDDGDGVPDAADTNPTDPNICRDVDNDTCDDCVLTGADGSGGAVNNDGPDTDGDGLCDAGDLDDDGDGVPDATDSDPANPNICADADADTCDDCAITGANGSGGSVGNDGADTDGDGQCDLGDADDDNDGVPDTTDSMPRNPNLCSDLDGDSCDDCAITGADGSGGSVSNDGTDTDGDGQCNASDVDDDNDGVPDAGDIAPIDPNLCRDVDSDGCDDCTLTGADGSGGAVMNDGLDTDGDGACDAGDFDDDDDGVPDGLDSDITNPFICRDTDFDGCDDCSVTGANASGGDPANDGLDTDGDRVCDASDTDDDNDGVPDASDSDPVDPFVCADADTDGCDDCAITGPDSSGGDVANDGPDLDADGQCDAGDSDRDNDGVINANDPAPDDPLLCGDVDSDTCDDCAVQVDGFGPAADVDPADDGPDLDGDGLCDAGDDDTDGDGVPNLVDSHPRDPARCADADADSCDDCALGVLGGDPAQDGADGDGDGICDSGQDSDGDGVPDHLDLDADNDGLPDAVELALGLSPHGDNDGDGIFDYLDADDRGDGQPSACLDTDSDGRCDALPVDVDSDGDGVPNHLDVDSDNDGIVDLVEAGHGGLDANGDGLLDGPMGANGLSDDVETSADSGVIGYVPRDTDADGQRDVFDVDSDDDGVPDSHEAGLGALDTDADGRLDDPTDAEQDGLRDVADDDVLLFGWPTVPVAGPDSDGDGIPDAYDADGAGPGPGDSNGDGLPDDVQCENPPGWPACPDDDNDGTPNYAEPQDTDGDGVADAHDVDADDDGVPDYLENNLGVDPYGDADGDGIPNSRDADDRGDGQRDCPDPDGDGLCEGWSPLFDTDGDGVPNHLDLDSDGDGIWDNWEAGLTALDTDGDGIVDGPRGNNGFVDAAEQTPDSGAPLTTPLDLDGDGAPDMRDLDTDGDGIFDVDEVPATRGLDTDGDGRVDGSTDLDGDGLVSTVDDDDTQRGLPGAGIDPTLADDDGDGIWDVYDPSGRPGYSGDSDGDGLLDEVECPGGWPCPDADGDGRPDYMDPRDSDGDGVVDGVDVDTDGDGIADSEENLAGIDPTADADGDGIVNLLDIDDRGDGRPNDCVDADGDGACEAPGPLFDTDGDGQPNHLDLDSDGDGLWDIVEADRVAQDSDGDGRTDGPVGPNGLSDALETALETGETDVRTDTDADAVPDFLDVDADDDGVLDEHEAAPSPESPRDTDGDGVADYRDTDSDDDGILDAEEAGDLDPSTPPIDTDMDGTPDMLDLDSDEDGLPDEVEAGDDDPSTPPRDSDGDGLADFRSTDSDGDGVNDGDDICLTVFDPEQADTDGDGAGDACDELDDRDLDGDGVTEGEDNCPTDPNPEQTDSDLDGLGDACDADADGDGVDDNIVLTGGGCSSTGTGDGSPWGALALAGMIIFMVGRRTKR